MITFREKDNPGYYDLVVEGETIEDCYAESAHHSQRGWITLIWIENVNVQEKLFRNLKNLSSNTAIVFEKWFDLDEINVKLHCGDYQREGVFAEGYITLECDLENWAFPFSSEEYFFELSRIFGTNVFTLKGKEIDDFSFKAEIRYLIQPKLQRLFYVEKANLHEELTRFRDLLTLYHNESITRLLKLHSEDIVGVFNFPEEIRFACQQYLAYFAQFLRDLRGIEATSELREEGGKTLFSVIPQNDFEALDNIKELLITYLSLPASPVSYESGNAALRLKHQIHSFHYSQRMISMDMEVQMAKGLVEAQQLLLNDKDAIIQQKDQIIEHQHKEIRRITSPSLMYDSLENKENLEKVIDGLSVGKSEFLMKQLGIHWNPVTFFTAIGKILVGKEESKISILELEEKSKEKDIER